MSGWTAWLAAGTLAAAFGAAPPAGAGSASPSVAVSAPQDPEARARRLFESGRYQSELPDGSAVDVPEVEDDDRPRRRRADSPSFGRMGDTANVVWIIVLVVGFVAVAAIVVHGMIRRGGAPTAQAARPKKVVPTTSMAPPPEAAEDPALAASEGRFADACAALLRRALHRALAPRGPGPGMTSRAAVAAAAAPPAAKRALADLAAHVEGVRFAGAPADVEAWREAVRRAQAYEAASERRA
ncbi:MAG TPA: DUF4129 domain-containing protein [Planctomycetota bacterium]|nr:DUF4129 domain-containing protein [Planctomycetota bacterium]